MAMLLLKTCKSAKEVDDGKAFVNTHKCNAAFCVIHIFNLIV